MEFAVCQTRLARTRCSVFATRASARIAAKLQAQTMLLGLRLRSATARKGRELVRSSRPIRQSETNFFEPAGRSVGSVEEHEWNSGCETAGGRGEHPVWLES